MVSVAIATFNGERYILQQLESIAQQTVKVDEVIICDDFSTDNTVSNIKSFIEKNNLKNWRLYINEENLGYALNFKKAIQMTSGDIIFLSDQDDIWIEDKVELMLEKFIVNHGIALLASKNLYIDEKGDLIKTSKKFDGEIFLFMLGRNSFRDLEVKGCVIAFRSYLKKYLGLLSDPKRCHDGYLVEIAIALGGYYVWNYPLIKYRLHKDNTTAGSITFRQIDRAVDVNLDKRIDILKMSLKHADNQVRVFKYYQIGTETLITFYKEHQSCLSLRLGLLQDKSILAAIKLFKYMPKHILLENILSDVSFTFGIRKQLVELSGRNTKV